MPDPSFTSRDTRDGQGSRDRVLVVNDVGIDSAGLHTLVIALAKRFDVNVAAPAVEKSASSHAINIHDPISAEPRHVPGAVSAFACGGGATPADCIMLALDVLFTDVGLFNVVVSEINRGLHVGVQWNSRGGEGGSDAR